MTVAVYVTFCVIDGFYGKFLVISEVILFKYGIIYYVGMWDVMLVQVR